MSEPCRRTPLWRRGKAPPLRIASSHRPPAPDRRTPLRRRQAPARRVAPAPRMFPSAVPAVPPSSPPRTAGPDRCERTDTLGSGTVRGSDFPRCLACALHCGRDAHGGQRDLRDHRARPHAAESQRGAAGTQVGEMRLHTRARDPQRREHRQHHRADDRETTGIQHRREIQARDHPDGAPPLPRLTLSMPHANARSTASRPIAAETDASTSASTKS